MIRKYTLLAGCVLLLCGSTDPTKEYQVKAVFMYNFAQFVEWPSTSFVEPSSPLILGVLGEDPFGKYLDMAVEGEQIDHHPLVVKRYAEAKEVKGCHLLFITKPKTETLVAISSTVMAEHVLTVGDADNFIQQGGMIRFFIEKERMRIQINVEAARDANLKISSKLLKVAEVVTVKK